MNQFKSICAIILDQIGYNSFFDLITNTIAFKHKITTIYLISVIFSSVIAPYEKFINDYIYFPALGIEILMATTILDLILGASAAIEQKQGLSVNKLSRGIIRFLIQIIFTGISFQMNNVWPHLIFRGIADCVLLVFILSTLVSAVQNAHKLGLIKDREYQIIESLLNIKNLINKIFKK